jgi:hypothetical protein
MNDAERDAWLREALRHAPDADAAPPRDLSETILAQARAAARAGRAPAREPVRRNRLVALWDWLARPPVAAGFASVMAATLVGLMWWDRPMDETLPRPEVASERAQAPAPPGELGGAAGSVAAPATTAGPAERAATDARGAADTAAAAAPARNSDAAPAAAQASRRRSGEGAATLDDAPAPKVQTPEARMQAPPAKAKVAEAKEHQRKLEAANDAAGGQRSAVKPAPFPRSDDERSAAAQALPAKKKDSDAKDGKATDTSIAQAPADALAARDTPLAKSAPVPSPAAVPAPAPAEVIRSEPPAAFGRQRANEVARTSPTANADAEAAKRAPAAAAPFQQAPATAAPAAAPPPRTTVTPTPAAAPVTPATQGSASADVGEKHAGALASPPAAQARSDVATAQREGALMAPLAPVLAAIASDPARWSRSTASGSVVALDAGWRDWLAQLDAAARGRWQPSADAAERDGAATLRLVIDGRAATVVRLDGTTVRVDAPERGERWQATLPPAAAERLRAAADRLGR